MYIYIQCPVNVGGVRWRGVERHGGRATNPRTTLCTGKAGPPDTQLHPQTNAISARRPKNKQQQINKSPNQ